MRFPSKKDIAETPTSKPVVYLFTLFLMTIVMIVLWQGKDLPSNVTSLLSIVASAIYGGYFIKSGYEHRVDRQYGMDTRYQDSWEDSHGCEQSGLDNGTVYVESGDSDNPTGEGLRD